MRVIWRRPDGYREARPLDFYVVTIGEGYSLWLHKSDIENFPFRISGDWQDEDGSQVLNRLTNLISKPTLIWQTNLEELFRHSHFDSPADFLKDLLSWLHRLQSHAKGDGWEIRIIEAAIDAIIKEVGRIELVAR